MWRGAEPSSLITLTASRLAASTRRTTRISLSLPATDRCNGKSPSQHVSSRLSFEGVAAASGHASRRAATTASGAMTAHATMRGVQSDVSLLRTSSGHSSMILRGMAERAAMSGVPWGRPYLDLSNASCGARIASHLPGIGPSALLSSKASSPSVVVSAASGLVIASLSLGSRVLEVNARCSTVRLSKAGLAKVDGERAYRRSMSSGVHRQLFAAWWAACPPSESGEVTADGKASYSTSSMATLAPSPIIAQCRGRQPFMSPTGMLAHAGLAARRSRTFSTWPVKAAQWSGRNPLLSVVPVCSSLFDSSNSATNSALA